MDNFPLPEKNLQVLINMYCEQLRLSIDVKRKHLHGVLYSDMLSFHQYC
jgi:hypothetical protein